MTTREWTSRIKTLASRERGALTDLLVALAEFDSHHVYRQLGFASLFDFLTREVGLSRGSAYYRQVAARLLRRFPEVVQPLRDGRLCLWSAVELSKVMTEVNRVDVLPRFFHCSKQEARQVVVELLPAEKVPTRTVVTGARTSTDPDGRGVTPPEATPVESSGAVQPVELDRTHPGGGMAGQAGSPGFRVADPRRRRTTLDPLSARASRIHITVSREFLALLERARAGESHRNPGATDDQILRLALEALLEKQSRRKSCVPPRVKREVRKRDEGKCQWRLANGEVCGSEVRTEIDHVVPRGRGGPSTVENCRVLCRAPGVSPRSGEESSAIQIM